MSAVVIPVSEEHRLRNIKPGPRLRMAARLYATGAVKTKRAAAIAVGVTPEYFTTMSTENAEIANLIGEVDRQINDGSIELSKVIALIARRAARKMNELIGSGNDHIALKASSDILDRNPETSKTVKATITSFHIDGQDAKELAAAMVQAAKVKEQFRSIVVGDFVRVEEEPNGKEEAHNQVRSRDLSRVQEADSERRKETGTGSEGEATPGSA